LSPRTSLTRSVTSGPHSAEDSATPATPASAGVGVDTAPARDQSPQDTRASNRFTSFDQIVPPARDEPEDKPPLTLHNATMTIHDDTPNDTVRIRSKPAWDYLIQIEPASAAHPGWMIVRKYSDFETLHEVLRRIAAVSGSTAFAEQHAVLPGWKVHTRASLRGELERYVRDACWFPALADSEGMRRFLERGQSNAPAPPAGAAAAATALRGLKWDLVGKNMLDALTTAPKGAMEGGKSVVSGVTGVFSNMGLGKRQSINNSPPQLQPTPSRLSLTMTRADTGFASIASRASSTTPSAAAAAVAGNPAASKSRDSLDSQRSSSVISMQPGRVAPMERRPSRGDRGAEAANGDWERNPQSASASARNSREFSRASSVAALRSPSTASFENMRLPPPPDAMPDDYESPVATAALPRTATSDLRRQNSLHSRTQSPAPKAPTPLAAATAATATAAASPAPPAPAPAATTTSTKSKPPPKKFTQLSEPETRVAVELMFAVINELYTLSSAWNIRRTLLAAAKSFLLRPGNPSLVSIQSLMQISVLDANTSDAGLAAHLRKLRENTMPTEAERAAWPDASSTAAEREKLRVKARALLLKSGVPAALMGVMGQAATGEALGKLFDSLQVEEVARGLMFGIILQAVRVVTH
jgi:hypothetical protein